MPGGEPRPGEEPGVVLAPHQPLLLRPLERRRQPGAEEPLVTGVERALVGRGRQMVEVDVGVGEIDGGRFHLPVRA